MYSCYNNLVKYALTTQFDIEVDVMYEVKLDAFNGCLLYTSDAADDLLCLDLGGRRIIKKKKGNF